MLAGQWVDVLVRLYDRSVLTVLFFSVELKKHGYQLRKSKISVNFKGRVDSVKSQLGCSK